jgi:hypothetical protein
MATAASERITTAAERMEDETRALDRDLTGSRSTASDRLRVISSESLRLPFAHPAPCQLLTSVTAHRRARRRSMHSFRSNLKEDSSAPVRTNSRKYPPLLACPKPFEKPFLFLAFKR